MGPFSWKREISKSMGRAWLGSISTCCSMHPFDGLTEVWRAVSAAVAGEVAVNAAMATCSIVCPQVLDPEHRVQPMMFA
jgi:hypothetical protein